MRVPRQAGAFREVAPPRRAGKGLYLAQPLTTCGTAQGSLHTFYYRRGTRMNRLGASTSDRKSLDRPRYGRGCPARLIAAVLVASLVNVGCGTMLPRYLGIRPDAPETIPTDALKKECEGRHKEAVADRIACEQYVSHVLWAQHLAEAYRTRATLNEWAIYVAGTIALAGLSVVSGLGLAAAASTETIGLIGVSTGFTSGFFSFMNNSTRAGFYTTAANDISSALSEATQRLGAKPNSETYHGATKLLSERVSQAANRLETKRYEAAAAAATSELVQEATRHLQQLTTVIETAAVVDLRPDKGKAGEQAVVVTAGIDLTTYKDRVRVFVDGRPAAGEVASKTEVRFTIPAKPAAKTQVGVRVYVGPFAVPGEQSFTYN